MGATNNYLTSVVISITAAAAAAFSFSSLLYLVDEAGGSDLGGDRVRSYTTNAAVQADADLSAAVKAAVAVMFGQSRHVATIKIGRVDTAAGVPETYPAALALVIAEDPDFFGICIDNRTDAVISAVAAAVEALDTYRLFVAQSKTAGLLTGTFPTGLTGIQGLFSTALTYHDEDTVPQAEAWLSYALSWEPDTKSNTWLLALTGVAALTTGLTETQRNFAATNRVNLALPYGAASHYMAEGVSMSGNPLDNVLTRAWLVSRIETGIATLRLAFSARGDKLTVDEVGQSVVLGVVNEWLIRGSTLQSPHFLPGQVIANRPTIVQNDRDERQIRIELSGTFAVDALRFGVDGNLSNTLVFTE